MMIFLDKTIQESICSTNQKIINNIPFTNREIDVVACLLGGRSTKKIALFLLISPKTVENHIHNIMLKLGCNSREHIIDHLEKSENFSILKEHYARILIKIAFELELKKIAVLIEKKDITCLNLCYAKQQGKSPFVLQLEKHLELANIKVYSIPLDTHQQNIYLPDTLKSQHRNNLVYNILSSAFLEQFIDPSFTPNLENLRLNGLIDKSLDIVFILLLQTPNSIVTYIKKNFPNYICIAEQTNYYYLILQILKSILSNNIDVEKNIVEFKRQHEILLNPTFLQQQTAEKDWLKEASIYYTSNYTTKLVILIGTIILLLIFYISFFILDIKKETLSLKHKLQKPINFSENHIEKISIQTEPKKTIILNLPLRNNKFTGREHYLAQIQEQLQNQKVGTIAQQVIVGLGGIGKTQLATEFAYRAAEKQMYPVILWITAMTTNTMYAAYSKFADNFEINSKGLSLNEIQQLVHKHLASHYNGAKVLFLLDNLPDSKGMQDYLTNLHQQSTNYFTPLVLITSRSQNHPEIPLILEPFSQQESIIFIKKQLSKETEKSIINLSEALHYFPLALAQAVAYINAHTNIDEYLKVYNTNIKEHLNVEASNSHDKYTDSLWRTWNIILSKLSKNAQTLLFIASYLDPDDIPIELFTNFNITERMRAIENLRKHSLIQLNNNKSFKIHRLLQNVIRIKNKQNYKWLQTTDNLDKAIELINQRFGFNYLDSTKWPLWQNYLTHAKTLSEYAIKVNGKYFNRGVQLYATVAMFMTHIILATDTKEIEYIWSNLLQLTNKYNSPLIGAIINTHLGNVKRVVNKFDESQLCFEKAIATYSQIQLTNNKDDQNIDQLMGILRTFPLDSKKTTLDNQIKYDFSYTLTRLGGTFNYRPVEPAKHIETYEKALVIIYNLEKVSALENIVKYQKVDLLNNLSKTHIYSGNFVLAEKLLTDSKRLADQIYVNHRQQALNYATLAQLYTHIGNFTVADQLFKYAFNILSYILSEQHFFINSLKVLMAGNSYMAGDVKSAESLLGDLIYYYKNYNNKNSYYWICISNLYLARIYELKKEYDKALLLSQESLDIASKHYKGNIITLMQFTLSRAETWGKLHKTSSITYWKKMLELIIQLFGKNHYQTARYHQLYGQALANKQQPKAAKEQYEKAMAILNKEKVKHPALIKFHQQNLQILQELINENKV